MINLNNTKIEIIAQIVGELLEQQTAAEMSDLYDQIGKVCSDVQLAADLAVRLFARISRLDMDTRALSPIDDLVDQAEATYHANYAG